MYYLHPNMDERWNRDVLLNIGCVLPLIGTLLVGRRASRISRELKKKSGSEDYALNRPTLCQPSDSKRDHGPVGWRICNLSEKSVNGYAPSSHWNRSAGVGRMCYPRCRYHRATHGSISSGRNGAATCDMAGRGYGEVFVRVAYVSASVDKHPSCVALRLLSGVWGSNTVCGCDAVVSRCC